MSDEELRNQLRDTAVFAHMVPEQKLKLVVVANVALIFTKRSWTRTIVGSLRESNPALWWVTGCAATLLAFLIFVAHSQRVSFRRSERKAIGCLLRFGHRQCTVVRTA